MVKASGLGGVSGGRSNRNNSDDKVQTDGKLSQQFNDTTFFLPFLPLWSPCVYEQSLLTAHKRE